MKFWKSSLFSLSTTTTTTTTKTTISKRRFQFIEYGATVDPEVVSKDRPNQVIISCDGRIPGVDLELTHWNGNTTPEKYYADTSTEMALKFPFDGDDVGDAHDEEYHDAIITNNHFDTDGVLAVFACLKPELARQYSQLLADGAAAGDFGEWTSDAGVKLDASLEAMCARCHCQGDYNDDSEIGDEAACYALTLNELPNLLQDFTLNHGAAYQELWQTDLDDAYKSWEAFQSGEATLEVIRNDNGQDGMVLTREPFWLSSYALSRALVRAEQEHRSVKINRILRAKPVMPSDKEGNHDYPSSSSLSMSSSLFDYRYEKPGHAWVQRLVKRRVIPPVAMEPEFMVAALNKQASTIHHQAWKKGGSSLVSIAHTTEAINVVPRDVAKLLLDLEGRPNPSGQVVQDKRHDNGRLVDFTNETTDFKAEG